jgi:hypothetical protein
MCHREALSVRMLVLPDQIPVIASNGSTHLPHRAQTLNNQPVLL